MELSNGGLNVGGRTLHFINIGTSDFSSPTWANAILTNREGMNPMKRIITEAIDSVSAFSVQRAQHRIRMNTQELLSQLRTLAKHRAMKLYVLHTRNTTLT